MKDFWKNIKQLFQSSEKSSPTQPAIHEMIERSAAEQEDYIQWKRTSSSKRLLDWLNNQHVEYIINPKHTDEAIDFLNTPSSKGFVIHFHETRYNKREIIHFFDFLKEKVLTVNYRTYMSDFRTYNRPDWVETIQRHYLKPSIYLRSNDQKKSKQLYGNITIQLLLRNDQVRNLKFSATSYKDHKFEDADDFRELIQVLIANDKD